MYIRIILTLVFCVFITTANAELISPVERLEAKKAKAKKEQQMQEEALKSMQNVGQQQQTIIKLLEAILAENKTQTRLLMTK